MPPISRVFFGIAAVLVIVGMLYGEIAGQELRREGLQRPLVTWLGPGPSSERGRRAYSIARRLGLAALVFAVLAVVLSY